MKRTTTLTGLAAAALTLSLLTGVQPAWASTTVPARNAGGVATISAGINDEIIIEASGTAQYGFQGSAPCVGYPVTHPDGSRFLGTTNCGPKDDPNATLAGAPVGLLIARVGSGSWFAAGSATVFCMPSAGTVYVAYNDSYYPDNTGSYTVTASNHGTKNCIG
jgi:hypothetical protein